jgi:predicted O-methyltransferase YrrM
MNHFSLGKVSDNILEIGFNAGHSSLLYLLSNQHSTITAFDLCYHPYVIPCFEYLKNEFSNRINLYSGDSNSTVYEYHKNNPTKKFDLIHIDGGHETHIANKDFFNSLKLASNIIIWDDTHLPHLDNLFNTYVQNNLIEEIYMHKTYEYKHRIGRVVA